MKGKIFSDRWLLQTSERVKEHGETISSSDYQPKDWYDVTIPGTVVSGLVENKVYEDPYYNQNLKKMSGYKHGVNRPFSYLYKPDDSPFGKSWWFRRTFTLPEDFKGKHIWLNFKGINERANIWLNQKRIAASNYVKGAFRQYDIDVTRWIKEEEENVLAVEVFSADPDDFCITFLDWCPVPPDDSMGLWQPVIMYPTGEVALKNSFIKSKLDLENLSRAELIIETELVNRSRKELVVDLVGRIEDISFQKKVTVKGRSVKKVIFTAEDFPQLKIDNPRVWWPYQLGSPELYELFLQCSISGQLSDRDEVSFGIRDISSRLNETGSRQFTINGQDIQLRGSAWAPDLMLRQSKEQDEIDITYLKNLNMNTVRMEGKLASDYFWELCDREGILVLAGWSCGDNWERWADWKPGDEVIARESLSSQLLRLRNHPSFTAWFYGSDYAPTPEVEKIYLQVLEELYPELPALASAADKKTKYNGETGVKMSGPYSYVPPIYWYDKEMPGTAGKFNTETGPDVCIPQLESLEKMMPEDELYVGSDAWNYHAGVQTFCDTAVVDQVIEKKFGKVDSVAEYAKAAQVLGYESWRGMYEAHMRNWPEATGVIGWMLRSSWPSMIWQMYDYFNMPNGAFFGAKKACEPLHVQYSYDDGYVCLVNTTLKERKNLKVRAELYTADLKKIFIEEEETSIGRHESKSIFKIPEKKETPLSFLFLSIYEGEKRLVKNVYWLPAEGDVFAEEDPKAWFHRPLKKYADLRPLYSLPKAEIKYDFDLKKDNKFVEIKIDLENISTKLAFFLQAKVVDSITGDCILPVYWEDNCETLLPKEKVVIKGKIPASLVNRDIKIKIEGWNL